MKWGLILVLILTVQESAFAAGKANREELLEAFDGKFVLISGQSRQACFSIQGNSIDIIKQKGKCDDFISISISGRGAVCLETNKRERCAKVRVLSNGDFAWGKSRIPITIFDSRMQLTGSASELDKQGESKLAREFYRKGQKLFQRGEVWSSIKEFTKSAE